MSGRRSDGFLPGNRRSVLLAGGMAMLWAAGPWRAMARLPAGSDDVRRIDELIARMTPEEKAGQLTMDHAGLRGGVASAVNPPAPAGSFAHQIEEAYAGRLSGVFNGSGVAMARRLQDAATRGSRLGIPMFFAADVIHGMRTVFPVPLAEAASFDPELARATARVAATEAAACGIDCTFAPMVDIARDQRWGRGVEGAGEDVLLGRLMAAARVRGFQGDRGLTAIDAVAACVKHFAAYGAAEAGLDYSAADISERTLREVYFPPFQAALSAQAAAIMPAFNDVAGEPATSNAWLLKDVLRGEWGFGGITVSDYTADAELVAHGVAADARDATRLAFLAGVDVCLVGGLYLRWLPDLVKAGEIPVAALDAAVRRVLRFKTALGLFDDPYRRLDLRRERRMLRTPTSVALARDAAARSIVLLRNEGELLPLPRAGCRLALIGPFATGRQDRLGPWNVYGLPDEAVDLAGAVREAVVDSASVTVTPGSGITEPLPGGIAAAVAAAAAADVVLLAIGEGEDMSGEAQSRADIVVPEAQMALAEAVGATGKPVVVLLRCGRALALEGTVRNARAILVTWFLGSEDGNGIADILFGRAAPSARLPISFPRVSGQQPFYYARRTSGRPNGPGPLRRFTNHYRDVANSALYPFGHGLTYGDIRYDSVRLSADILGTGQDLDVVATLINAGQRPATEVVQLYVQDVTSSVTRPRRELKAFKRVTLAPGERGDVGFVLRVDDLRFLDHSLKPVIEPGAFRLWVAPSAEADGAMATFRYAVTAPG